MRFFGTVGIWIGLILAVVAIGWVMWNYFIHVLGGLMIFGATYVLWCLWDVASIIYKKLRGEL